MRIVIVDDHPVFRDGLRLALASSGCEIVGEAGTVAEAIHVAEATQPDVVLMDLQLPDGSGIDATTVITQRQPATRIVALTMSEDDDAVFAALKAGATGYLLKGSDRTAIVGAIDAVMRGEAVLGAGVATRVLAQFAQQEPPTPLPELSDREREVLKLVAEGLTNAAIGERLYVASKTVRNHVSNILMKLQVESRSEAADRARDAGLR